MRHKEINAIRMHASVKFAADFALGMVTEKLRSRIKFYVSLESAKTIDRSILPLEYGGSIPMAQMIGKVLVCKSQLISNAFNICRHFIR